MMAGKNQAALAVCAQTKVIFPFKYILTVIDVFSKYAWAVPVKDKSAASVKKILKKKQ